MPSEHESFFSYNITRPYPFRWFTPVVIVGGLISVALFTFLSFVSSGYNLSLESSTNPNATVANEDPFHKWPSVLAKVKPRCQAVNIPINTRFFTNHTALTYNLAAVWMDDGTEQTIYPALSYHNNVIEECRVNAIDMDLEALDRSANQLAFSEWGAVVRTFVTCRVSGEAGTVYFNATQNYDYVPNTVSYANLYEFLGTNFLTRDKHDEASLWWGESLLSTYWTYTTRLMQDIRVNTTANRQPAIRKGTVSFAPTETTNITDLDFFNVKFRFIVDDGGGNFQIIGSDNSRTRVAALANNQTNPNIWIPADSLAKSIYSTVLADLGQASTPNILTDEQALEYFTFNFTRARQNLENATPGPANDSFSILSPTTGPLGITNSVIANTYLCQVPQLKSTGNLIVAILVADLVFLQAVWWLFKLGVDEYLTRRKPNSNACSGCNKKTTDAKLPLSEKLGVV